MSNAPSNTETTTHDTGKSLGLRMCRWAGMLVQSVVLGILFFFAVGKLIALESGARIFSYQAF